MNNNVIIVAGGDGSRFNNKIPKQFSLLNEIRIINYSINTFSRHNEINKIIIACHPDWRDKIKEENPNIIVVNGGDSRRESCRNGFLECDENIDNILIHDAARPFVTNNIISNCIQGLNKHNASSPALNINDTVIKIKNRVYKRMNRDQLFLMQTPQGFKRKILKTIIDSNNNDTDEISTYIEMFPNNSPYLFNGEIKNFKITTKEDIVKAINYFK